MLIQHLYIWDTNAVLKALNFYVYFRIQKHFVISIWLKGCHIFLYLSHNLKLSFMVILFLLLSWYNDLRGFIYILNPLKIWHHFLHDLIFNNALLNLLKLDNLFFFVMVIINLRWIEVKHCLRRIYYQWMILILWRGWIGWVVIVTQIDVRLGWKQVFKELAHLIFHCQFRLLTFSFDYVRGWDFLPMVLLIKMNVFLYLWWEVIRVMLGLWADLLLIKVEDYWVKVVECWILLFPL